MPSKAQKDFLKKTFTACEDAGERLTAPRRAVLEIIAGQDKPIGAYDILRQLGDRLDNPKPPTAYRAIEFWQGRGVIHRIESLNAYVICRSDHHHDGSQFMICDSCGTVGETHLCTLPSPLAEKTKEAGFTLSRWNVELHGTCRHCSGK